MATFTPLTNWMDQAGFSSFLLSTSLILTLLLSFVWALHAALGRCNPHWRVVLWRAMSLFVLIIPLLQLLPTGEVLKIRVAAPVVQAAGRPGEMQGRMSSASESPKFIPVSSDSITQKIFVPISVKDVLPAKKQYSDERTFSNYWNFHRLTILAWLTGIGLLLLHCARGLMTLRRWCNDSMPAPGYINSAASKIARELGCRSSFDVRLSKVVSSPVLLGLRRPRILIPEALAGEANAENIEAILAHEIAHLRGGDAGWSFFLKIVCILGWPHPLLWRVGRAHANAYELVCDAAAASHVGSVEAYTRTLAQVALMARRVPSTAIPMARGPEIVRRIDQLGRQLFALRISRRRLAMAACLALPLVIALGALRFAWAEPMDPDKANKQAAQISNHTTTHTLLVRVIDRETKKPLAGTKVKLQTSGNGHEQTANQNGEVEFKLPGASPDYAKVSTELISYVPTAVTWRFKETNETVPDEFTIPIERGTIVGGSVVDDAHRPIQNAQVFLLVPQEELRKHGEKVLPAIWDRVVTTDANGHWTFDQFPSQANEVWIKFAHPEFSSDNTYGQTARFSVKELREQTARAVLKKGLTLRGEVLEPDGKPIAGASVTQGRDRFGSNYPATTTDKDGVFTFSNTSKGEIVVVAHAAGHAPDIQTIQFDEKTEPIKFKLEPGHSVRGRVVDSKGEPVAGVLVCPDTWRGCRPFAGTRFETDKDGNFIWENGPADEVLYDIIKQEYMSVRRQSMTAREKPWQVTMRRPLVVTGTVLDKQTRQPITGFSIQKGIELDNGRPAHWETNSEGLSQGKNGNFSVQFREPRNGYYVRANAEGYLPVDSQRIPGNEERAEIELVMEKGEGPHGVVLDSEAKPIPGVSVALVEPGGNLQVSNGEFGRVHNGSKTETDASGAFKFPTGASEYRLAAVDQKHGYGEIDSADFKTSGKIQLKPWGSVRGTVHVGKRVGANLPVRFDPDRSHDQKFNISQEFKTTTNADGAFVFEHIPLGQGRISREYPRPNGGLSFHSLAYVEITPDKSLDLKLGGNGRPVYAQVTMPDGKTDFAQDQSFQCRFVTKFKMPDIPEEIKADPEKAKTWWETWSKSEEGFKAQAASRAYNIEVDRHGRLTGEDIVPGEYQLSIQLINKGKDMHGGGDPVAQVATTVTVVAAATMPSDEAFDLGTFKLKLRKIVEVGQQAPGFDVKTLEGKPLKLSDYKGKYVLVDFWATWCGPCVADIPNVKAAWDKFGSDPRFALISLSLDQNGAAPQKFAAQKGLSWPQGFLGEWTKTEVPNEWGVYGIPSTFLINPDGKIIAKGIRGAKIVEEIEKALQSP